MINRLIVRKKKKYTVIVFGLFYFTNISENDDKEYDNLKFRERAWNSLSDEERSTVLVNWEEAKVKEGSYWLTNKQAIIVEFSTTEDHHLGPILVFIDPKTHEILGQSIRE